MKGKPEIYKDHRPGCLSLHTGTPASLSLSALIVVDGIMNGDVDICTIDDQYFWFLLWSVLVINLCVGSFVIPFFVGHDMLIVST